MKLKAYAKVNLCLKVYKGVSDAKHRIDSVMCLYKKLYDKISIRKSNELFVLYKENGKDICLSDCIVAKSLKYLNTHFNIDINYKIKIVKRIPFGGGLGGGSSDAAAVINYVLSQNPGIQLDLKDIALELGSDIPFFLSQYEIARVGGYGETVAPIYNWRPSFYVDTNNIVCATTEAFTSLEEDDDYVSKVNVDRIIDNHLYKQHNINVVYNDLTKYIIQNHKELHNIYKKYGNKSFFTGAGSSIVTLKD